MQHVLDREIANRRRRLEQILGSKRLVTALSNSIKKTAEVGSLYVSYDQILSEAAKAKSLLEELIELDTTRENLRDDVNLEGLAYEKKTEKGYSLRGEVYQYLFGFKWL